MEELQKQGQVKEETRSFYARKLIIIESLKKEEYASGFFLLKRLSEQSRRAFETEYISVQNKGELLALLERIHNDIKANLGVPILHFTMHGNENGIGLASDEFMPWRELSLPILKINIASANNLFITMAACFGFFVASVAGELKNSHMRSFFWCILGRQDSYSAGEFTNDYANFYIELNKSQDMSKALYLLDNDRKEYKIYHSEFLFLAALKVGFSRNIRVEIEKIVRKNHILAKRAGKKTIVSKAKMPEFAFKLWKDGVLKWRDSYFMVDLYPENESRFISKEKVERKIMKHYNKSAR